MIREIYISTMNIKYNATKVVIIKYKDKKSSKSEILSKNK